MESFTGKALFFLLVIKICTHGTRSEEKFSVAFRWNFINYTWPSPGAAASAGYIAGEDVIAGIKIYNNAIYLALPRYLATS